MVVNQLLVSGENVLSGVIKFKNAIRLLAAVRVWRGFLFGIVLMSLRQGLASERLYCSGGFEVEGQGTMLTEMTISSWEPVFFASGELHTDKGDFVYKVYQLESDYIYEILKRDEHKFYLQGKIDRFPLKKSVTLEGETQLFIDCFFYSQRDYCRYNTCQ